MVDNAFAAALRTRLEERTGSARSEWLMAEYESGADGAAWASIVQRIGLKMTWVLWDIAIEEAGAVASRSR